MRKGKNGSGNSFAQIRCRKVSIQQPSYSSRSPTPLLRRRTSRVTTQKCRFIQKRSLATIHSSPINRTHIWLSVTTRKFQRTSNLYLQWCKDQSFSLKSKTSKLSGRETAVSWRRNNQKLRITKSK